MCTNLLDAHAYKHTAYGGCQITEPFSYQKRHLGFMSLLCFAHCSQLQINRCIVYLSFTDRQTRRLFLPLQKSRNCFHTPPTGTVPFIKEIYLELSRGAAKEWGKDEHWLNLSVKMFEALCYFITAQARRFAIKMRRSVFCFQDPESRQHTSKSVCRWLISRTQLVSITCVPLDEQVSKLWPRHLCMCQRQLGS